MALLKKLLVWWAVAVTCCSEASPVLTLLGNNRPFPQTPGCVKRKINQTSSSTSLSGGAGTAASGTTLLDCQLRTLSSEPLTDGNGAPLGRDQLLSTRSLQIKCSDKLLFDSFLLPNQTLFQMSFLEEVSISSCKIRSLPGNVWLTLSYLKKLKISSKNGDWSTSVSLQVENDAFQGLGQLTTLDLSENNIWTLPETIFCPLRALQKLNISWNRLSELEEINPGTPEANYCSLSSVTSVDVGFNQLRRVGRIVKWKKLTELKLENNFIEELQDDAFAELSFLKSVNLSSNRLVALPPSIFKFNGNSLREIYLANNSISALAPAVFSGLNSLLLLDISRNTLTSQWIRERMFHGLGRLLALRLSYNQLSSVDGNIFKDLVNLQSLNLDHNRIESVAVDAFRMNVNLRVLDLSHNRLVRIEDRSFGGLRMMKQLYLDHNKIRGMEENILENCTELQDLGLADNLLQEVPLALRALHSLQTLDLGENRITTVTNSSFTGLSQLFGLRLVDNRLVEIPPNFCAPLTKLRVLNLAQNRLSSVSPFSFTTCPELRALRLDTNLLVELPQNLALPSLLWLNISENRLESVNYRSIPSTVEWLDLSHNQLKVISNSVPGTAKSQLRVLDLSYNQLTHLDGSVIPSSLETLRLNQNRVKSVAPDTFGRSERLRRVELTFNELETLTLTALRFPPIPLERPLPEFFLGNNPFVCDCNLEWMTRLGSLTALRQHPRVMDLDQLTCQPILGNNNKTVLTAAPVSIRNSPPDQFLCPYKSHCFALCHCCEFDACDCEMTCPQNCSCYHDTVWSRNIVQCSSSNQEQIPPRIPMDATEIHLDGNNLPALNSHIFIGKKNLHSLFLNGSRVESIRNKTFNGLKSLQVLHLQNNLLPELYGYEFKDVENLRELYLQNNLLRAVSPVTFSSLRSLQVLRLDGNFLVSFSIWELDSNPVLSSVWVSENPWSCDCDFVSNFRSWVYAHTSSVRSWDEISCRQEENIQGMSSVCNSEMISEIQEQGSNSIEPLSNDRHMLDVVKAAENPNQDLITVEKREEANNNNSGMFWTLLITSIGFLLILLVLLVLFRRELRSKLGHCSLTPGSKHHHHHSDTGSENEKLFDAYFLYSRKDEDVILEKIIPELETGPNYFRLCLHYRDLCLNPENPWNYEMIQSACDASKRLVLVLSSAFFSAEWAGNGEFRSSMEYILSRPEIWRKLILVVIPPCGRESLGSFLGLAPPNMSSNNLSLLEWSDKSFWSRLKQALPSPMGQSSLDHPMLIPATYTISRSHGNPPNGVVVGAGGNGDYSRRNTLNSKNYINSDSFCHNFPPTYQQSVQQSDTNKILNHPPPPIPPWQMLTSEVHPVPSHPFVSFNESFKRHQQMTLQQQNQQQQQQQQQALRLQRSSQHHHHTPHHPPPSSRLHSHSHQDSNCSNMSNNSRRPLNASSPGYSSSVETNLSSSNEELDHVYSTLDSPMTSPKPYPHPPGVMGERGASKLINPYSPTNINNNGDPTMYFV